jgi:hypothetical protein
VVSGCDAGRRGLARRRRQRFVPRRARPRLQVSSGADVDPRPGERDGELLAETLGQIELGARLLPEAVVDSMGNERESDLRSEQRKHVHQGRRIAAAAERHQDPLAPGEVTFVSQGAFGDFE